MSNEQSDKNCAICYEEREDLRMLPCWHVACVSCLLSMTQTGQGRAVKCHVCREPFLFENVRSLPRPVECKLCHKIVKNPKKFPCSPTVYCTGCADTLPGSVDGSILCLDFCKDATHHRIDLLRAKICPMCLCIHSSPGLDCGHNICSGCGQVLAEQRNCPLCVAMNAPMPTPANPVANIAMLAGRRQVSFMQAMSAIRILIDWQRKNNPEFQKLIKDLLKIVTSLVLFLIVAFIWGFRYWIWAVFTTTLCILKPKTIDSNAAWTILAILMFAYLIWNYFFYTVLLIVLETSYQAVCQAAVDNNFRELSSFIKKHDGSIALAKIALVFCIFPGLEVHAFWALVGFIVTDFFCCTCNR